MDGAKLSYYRNQCNELGASVLKLQQQLTETRRDARRQRTIIRLMRRLYNQAALLNEQTPCQPLSEILIGDLVESLSLDCAALLHRCDENTLCVEYGLGVPADFRLPLPSPCAPQMTSTQAASQPAETLAAIESLHLTAWAWVASPTMDKLIFLGLRQPRSALDTTGLDDACLAIPATVLEIYLQLLEQQRMTETLRESAFRDPLTLLPNRISLLNRLAVNLERCHTTPDNHFALLCLDINRFKIINDSLGHTLGDHLLVAVGQRLKSCLRDCDMIACLGGDEFLVLLDPLNDPEDAERCSERLTQALNAPFNIHGYEIFISASIGIVHADARYTQPEAMLRDADIAMSHAKRSDRSKGQWMLFDPGMHQQILQRMELERDLRWALERQEFLLHYQPIINITTGQIKGFEALIRWQHPVHGMVPPDQFIPLAEETLLILDIGRFVLTEGCHQAIAWAQRFAKPPTININLSGRQFMRADLPSQIGEIITDLHCLPSQINLEITESALLSDPDAARASLDQLHALGFTLSMDDFGTGYSSLSYLHQFPFDIIKIDRSFIRALGEDASATSIVTAILGLAQALDKQIVAEGIETAEQLALLQQLGCHYGQGYYFSRPLDAAAAETFLQQYK